MWNSQEKNFAGFHRSHRRGNHRVHRIDGIIARLKVFR
jgi:hypothetical protein